MSSVLTSNDLIKSIKRRGMIPENQITFEDTDFLDMLNEELNYFGVSHLLSTHEEYLVTYKDIQLESDVFEYEIPSRAIGNKLRGLFYKDSNSNSRDNLYEIVRIQLEDIPGTNNTNSTYTEGSANTFYIRENSIVLQNEFPFTDGFLRMYFYLKPNSLVVEDRVGKIIDINRTTGIITLDKFPDNFSLELMDFIQAKSPNKILGFDITPLNINTVSKTVTFTPSDIPDLLLKNDYLALAEETIVLQLPTEIHPILAQRVAVAALEALGDEQGVARAQSRLDMMEKSVLSLIDNRVESSVEKVKNRNSPLQQSVIGSHNYGRRGRS